MTRINSVSSKNPTEKITREFRRKTQSEKGCQRWELFPLAPVPRKHLSLLTAVFGGIVVFLEADSTSEIKP